jgi:hypothetical protein
MDGSAASAIDMDELKLAGSYYILLTAVNSVAREG